MKIFLVGMPGSGKTTLGNALAQHLGVTFVDLDAEIEKVEGKAIAEIFRQQGEDHFRLVEARLLREWAASAHAFVMATGGGAPCFHEGMQVINESGLSIFLDCPVRVLFDRVKHNSERPLLRSEDEQAIMKKLEVMRNGRLPCYRKAKIALEDPTLETLLRHIRR